MAGFFVMSKLNAIRRDNISNICKGMTKFFMSGDEIYTIKVVGMQLLFSLTRIKLAIGITK
jgi:hypothetical protein